MLQDATYREWTKPFNETSYFVGNWEKGSKILFLGTSPDGQQGGMVSHIEESRAPEFVSIKHLGIMKNGKEILEGPEVEAWAGGFENYTLNEKDGGTELIVDVDLDEKEAPAMQEMWDKAFARLKELAEK